jgi:phosphoribosylformylglycinamidine (FGAM) synthase-like amidotransferase family enzyme
METMTKPQALVLKGDGINCDNETVWALELAGFSAQPVHVSAFIENQSNLMQAKLLVLPGGFSFGDEIASGKVLALKLHERVTDSLYKYIDGRGLVIGICNGFQVLTQLGILPRSQPQSRRLVTLTKNSHGHFNNRWVDLTVSVAARAKETQKAAPSFFAGLHNIELPIRHGEGRLVVGTGGDDSHAPGAASVSSETDAKSKGGDKNTGGDLLKFQDEVKSCAPLRYRDDVNGSFDRIAALTNAEGTVMGLMPHPEAFVRWTQHPGWTSLRLDRPELADTLNPLDLPADERPHGFTILRNAFEMVS